MSEIYKNNHMDPRLLRTQERALQAHGREVIVKQVEIYLRRSAAKLRAEGVPLAASGNARIDMMTFCNKGAMDEAEVYRDLAYIGGMETGWQKQQAHTGLRLENNDDKKLKQGERLEILKTALFQKYLDQDFIVARSSEYDDVTNGVDNVIVDRHSGNLVCAFDEVGEESGSVFEKKKDRIMTKNIQGGAKLKYGFSISTDQKITLGAINNIPIFYLAMSPDKIETALRSFDEQGQSEKDWAAFKLFLDLIMAQINELTKPDAKVQMAVKEKAAKIGAMLRRYQRQ